MTLRSRLFAMYGRLPPATTHRIRIERGLRARMDDGVELVADRLFPVGGDKLPIVLIRSPYGRTGFIKLLATVFAERGYQTVLQSCRGTGGSGGMLDPLRNEGSDGRQTLAWVAEQPCAPPGARSEPDRYRYDPADPTPFVGGNTLGKGAGAKDNRRFETRSDVLVYTTDGLERDLEVIGQVSAEIHVRSSRPDTDFFVRLCDVFPDGRSINVTDGPVRVNATLHPQGPDGVTCVEVRLWPTGYLFKRGHRVRLQVSSGATPRISPNLGNGERLETATTPYFADQELFHDRDHPTAIVLPVTARG